MKQNPFNPNSPVNTGMFVGRSQEIKAIAQSLLQVQSGTPSHFMITGERGIGKTSLLLLYKGLARGDLRYENTSFNFLVLDLDVDPTTTQVGLVSRIELHLKNELSKTENARAFFERVWGLVQRIKVMDSGIDPATSEVASEEVYLDNFCLSFANTCNRITNTEDTPLLSSSYDGILLLIDEADNCSSLLNLGSFLKIFTERMTRYGCNNFALAIAGLPALRKKLIDSHPSSARIFNDLELARLNIEEIKKIINICIEKANKCNADKTYIDKEAIDLLVSLSEGYPHFIQQFGYSAFNEDSDGNIDKDDVIRGSVGTNGALNAIGNRYYRNDFYNKIQKESYRQVLRIMADDLDSWVEKSKIASKYDGTASTLNNALKALRDRHIILTKEGERGVYRLQDKGFALWIKLFSEEPTEKQDH